MAAPSSERQMEIEAEQLRLHYLQIPAMAIAQFGGALFTSWVLWDAVPNRYLAVGILAVLLLSAFRLLICFAFLRSKPQPARLQRWKLLTVAAAAVSGGIWGSAAPLLYPPSLPEYEVYLLVLLTVVPIIPIVALAAYMPTFYAFYLPCVLPFIVTLTLRGTRAETLTAVLLVLIGGAMTTFAHRYASSLKDAVRLRLDLGQRTRELEQRSRELEHANQDKTRLIASASHDLRQPVHAIGLFFETLRSADPPKARRRELVAHIDAALHGLRALLDNVLDISRLDARAIQARRRDFAATDLLSRLEAEFSPQAQRAALRLHWRVQALVLHSDMDLIERILRNLLSNALKFTPAGGDVTCECVQDMNTCRLSVRDTGPGIPQDRIAFVMREYTQIGRTEPTGPSGVGLGLAIVHRLARQLDHPLEVDSAAGAGATFTLRVPLARDPSAVQRLAPLAPLAAARRPRKIVLLDDDEATRLGAGELLRRWGHTCVSAGSARDLAKMPRRATDTPELLIADYWLGEGCTGLQAIDELRKHFQSQTIPAIVITGDTDPQRIRETYAAGHLVLHKPVDPARLQASIDAIGTPAAA